MTKSSECAAPLATTLRKRQQVRADEDEPASRPGNWTGKPTDVCVANPPRHLPARSSESQYSQRRSSTTLATGSESARPLLREASFVLFLVCFETAASWQHCVEHHTTSAKLSKLGATPAAQVSGGQGPPSAKQVNGHCKSSFGSAHHLPPSSNSQTARHLTSPGTRDSLEVKRRPSCLTQFQVGHNVQRDEVPLPRSAGQRAPNTSHQSTAVSKALALGPPPLEPDRGPQSPDTATRLTTSPDTAVRSPKRTSRRIMAGPEHKSTTERLAD